MTARRGASGYYEIRVEPETADSAVSRQFIVSALELLANNIPSEGVTRRVRLRITNRKDGSDLVVFDNIEYEAELETLERTIRDDLDQLDVHDFESKYRNVDPNIGPQIQWRRLLAPRDFAEGRLVPAHRKGPEVLGGSERRPKGSPFTTQR